MVNTHQISRKERFTILVGAFCAALAFTMSFAAPKLNASYRQTALSTIFWTLSKSLANTSPKSTLLFVCFLLLGQKTAVLFPKKTRPVGILSFCIAVVWLLGKGYSIDNSLQSLDSSWGQICKSLIYLTGSTWLLTQLGYLLERVIHDVSLPINQPVSSKLLQKHPFLISFLICLLFWLPHTASFFPGNMCFDAWHQLVQYYDLTQFTTHHPPAHTYLLGKIVDLGVAIRDGELGIFLFVLLQIFSAAAAVAYSIGSMLRLKAPAWLVYIGLGCAALSPIYTSYVNVVLKDNLFSYAFLVFMTEFVNYLRFRETFFKDIKHLILLPFSVVCVLLLRNNGKYVIYILAFALICICLLAKQKKSPAILGHLKFLALLLIPVLIAGGINGYLTESRSIIPGSRREMLSLPFQQTARYLTLYADEVTDSERAAIDAVLDYDTIAEVYDPIISDPVKMTFKDDATTADLISYFRVWLKQFTKHPLVYFHATMNQNYYLLYPGIDNNALYHTTYVNRFASSYAVMDWFTYSQNETMQKIRITDDGFLNMMITLPVVGVFTHTALYNIVLLMLLLFALLRKHWQWLLAALPLVVSVLVIVAAPVIQRNIRYAFPILFSMPIVVAYYISLEMQRSSISE